MSRLKQIGDKFSSLSLKVTGHVQTMELYVKAAIKLPVLLAS